MSLTIRQRCAELLRSTGWEDSDAGFDVKVEAIYSVLEGRTAAALPGWTRSKTHEWNPNLVGTEVCLLGGARPKIEAAYALFELSTGQIVSRDCFDVAPEGEEESG